MGFIKFDSERKLSISPDWNYLSIDDSLIKNNMHGFYNVQFALWLTSLFVNDISAQFLATLCNCSIGSHPSKRIDMISNESDIFFLRILSPIFIILPLTKINSRDELALNAFFMLVNHTYFESACEILEF